MLDVTRRIFAQDEHARNEPAGLGYPVYAGATGPAMLAIRPGPGTSEMIRSEDNGVTWTATDSIPAAEPRPDGRWAKRALGPFFVDPENGRIIRFEREFQMTEDPATVHTYQHHVKVFIPNSQLTFCQISADGGHNWGQRRQLIETGPNFDAVHWAQGATFMQSTTVIGEVPPFLKLSDGSIMIPHQGRLDVDAAVYGTIQAGRFIARWNEAGDDLTWRMGSMVPGGGCEQTIARLTDGRLLNILRSQGQITPYPFSAWERAYAISDDDGETWSRPQPLAYRDGSGLTSPRAWSQLIRSSVSGKLYWIANILPALDTPQSEAIRKEWPSRADPRYPLQIVEVDESDPSLVKETLTVLIDREPDETRFVRFSNFFAYEDRETGELQVLLKKAYSEYQPNVLEMPEPSYRISVRVG